MRGLMAIPVAFAVAGMPALAEEPTERPKDQIVCKRTETTSYTGSHLARPKKTCRTASEWKLLEQEKDTTLSRVRDGKLSPNQPGTVGGGPN